MRVLFGWSVFFDRLDIFAEILPAGATTPVIYASIYMNMDGKGPGRLCPPDRKSI